jgi:hypothetical protein
MHMLNKYPIQPISNEMKPMQSKVLGPTGATTTKHSIFLPLTSYRCVHYLERGKTALLILLECLGEETPRSSSAATTRILWAKF